jgi:orotate phosphoribosyltransferase
MTRDDSSGNTRTSAIDASLTSRLHALLLDRSVRRGRFILASGRSSTYYIDARRTTMSGEGQAVIGDLALSRLRLKGWHPVAVGGLTLGADPVAYAIAAAAHRAGLAIDAFTVRKQAKEHGTGRRIEGCFAAGDAVVVIEDVITTGQSALEAIRAVVAAGAHVLGVLAVVDREEGGRLALERAGYAVEAMVTASDLGLVVDAG